MKKIIWTYGAIASFIVIVMMAAAVVLHENNPQSEGSMLVGYLGMLIAFAFNFVALSRYRRDHAAEGLTFGKGLKICLLISLITTIAYVAAWGIAYHFFFPDFMDKYLAMEVAKYQDAGLTAQQVAAKTASIRWMAEHYDNPFIFSAATAMEIVPVALGMSLIASLILRRKPTSDAVQMNHS